MRFITTSYLLFIVWLEASCSHFTLSGFEECENTDIPSFNDGDIALLCEGEQDQDGICKIPGYSNELQVAFNYTIPKCPDCDAAFAYMVVDATAFGNGTSGSGAHRECNIYNEIGNRYFSTIEEGDKLIARCKVPIDVFGISIGVIGRIEMNFNPAYKDKKSVSTAFDRYGRFDPNVTRCATHVVQWI